MSIPHTDHNTGGPCKCRGYGIFLSVGGAVQLQRKDACNVFTHDDDAAVAFVRDLEAGDPYARKLAVALLDKIPEKGSADGDKTSPNRSQLYAISRFAVNHGENWKEDLLHCWQRGFYPNPSDRLFYTLLHQVCVQFGPEWLATFELSET